MPHATTIPGKKVSRAAIQLLCQHPCLNAPGRFRKIQNWIGKPSGTVATASYTPPLPREGEPSLAAWEKFLHKLAPPPLVTIALAHYQFEAIHPFLNGNGRVARPQKFPSKMDYYAILTTGKVCGQSQLTVQAIDQENTAAGLFTVELLTREKITELVGQYPEVERNSIAACVSEEVATVNAKLDHIVTLTPSVSSSTATGEIDAPIDKARPESGPEQTRNCISSYVSGAREELLHEGKKEAHPTNTATFVPPWTQITDLEVARMVNQVTNRILGLGEEVEPGSVQ